jgi:hypothetical protein
MTNETIPDELKKGRRGHAPLLRSVGALPRRRLEPKDDIRRAIQVAELGEIGAFEELTTETHRRRELSEKAAHRAVHRKYFGSAS